MKKLLLSLGVCLVAYLGFAQAPSSFNFQAVARDAAGEIIPTKSVSFRMSILKGSAVGATLYQETHSKSTNQYGLVNFEIGLGTVVSGNFSSIDWGADKYFLKVEMDANGGSTYTEMGVQQLISVPYALNAKSADMADSVLNSDNDNTNELQTVSKTGNNLTLSNGGGTISVADGDSSKTNEIQTLSKTGLNLSLSNGGGTVSVADNDNDTSNEIQTISIGSGSLNLSKSGGFVPLNSLNHWNKAANDLYYNSITGNVGIGTNSPAHKFHVTGSGDTATAYFYNGTSGGSAVKGSSTNGPTNGYLGVQSRDGMDNNSLIKFPGGSSGREVAVLGVSTGLSSTDNIGVMGLTNGGWPGYFKNTGSKHQVSIATNSYGLSVDSGALNVVEESFFRATASLGARLDHIGDNNTYMEYTDDRIQFYSGGVPMLNLVEGTTDYLLLAPAGTTYKTKVGIGAFTSIAKLYVRSNTTDDNSYGILSLNYNDLNVSAYGISSTVETTWAYNNSTVGVYGGGRDRRTGTGTRSSYGVYGSGYTGSTVGTSRSYGIYGTFSGNADLEYAGYFAGRVYSTVGFTTSDQNLKTNISPLTSSLDKLMLLPVKTYDFKTEEYAHMNLPEGNHTGIMAQDLQKTYPELVAEAAQPAMDSAQQAQYIEDGLVVPEKAKEEVTFMAVNYTGLVPHLVKATQEQQALIVQQKQDIEALKKQVADQQKLLQELLVKMGLGTK